MQVCHTLVEAPCNPQCVGAHPKLKAGTIRNTTIQQAQYKNTTSATQEHNKRNTRTLKQRDRNAECKKP
jgi:hypothetical protein